MQTQTLRFGRLQAAGTFNLRVGPEWEFPWLKIAITRRCRKICTPYDNL